MTPSASGTSAACLTYRYCGLPYYLWQRAALASGSSLRLLHRQANRAGMPSQQQVMPKWGMIASTAQRSCANCRYQPRNAEGARTNDHKRKVILKTNGAVPDTHMPYTPCSRSQHSRPANSKSCHRDVRKNILVHMELSDELRSMPTS